MYRINSLRVRLIKLEGSTLSAQVLIPAMHLHTLPQGIEASTHGSLELRGFPGEIEVFELSGQVVHAPSGDTSELWTRPRFSV